MKALLIAVLTLAPARAEAADVVVLLASDRLPYQQALDGFTREFGKSVSVVKLKGQAETLPSDTRVVVALGGKAALQRIPEDAMLVYGMAPGVQPSRPRSGSVS